MVERTTLTGMNALSSRVQFHLYHNVGQEPLNDTADSKRSTDCLPTKLHLAALAGLERVKRAVVKEHRFTECMNIKECLLAPAKIVWLRCQ